MLDRGKFEEDWLSVSMLDAAGEFVPEVGEQGVELSLALTGDCQKVGGCRWTKDEPQSFGMVNIFFVFRRAVNSRREVGSRDCSGSIVMCPRGR